MAIRERPIDSPADQLRRGREEAREIGSEIGEIAQDLRELAMAESRLAQAEVKENLNRLINAVIFGAAAALFAILMLVFVFLTVMFVLDLWFQLWAAALITTGVLVVLTAALGALAYSMIKKFSITPQRTMESVKEDLRWLKSLTTLSAR